jgi:hypothetical protein
MGAWGVGMQAGDDALDAIHAAGGEEKVAKARTARQVHALFARWMRESCRPNPMGLLGLAEAVLDAGGDLDLVSGLVRGVAAGELAKDRLDCWSDPAERRAALRRFLRRLDGKPVPPEKLEGDNEGLLSKIGRAMGGA